MSHKMLELTKEEFQLICFSLNSVSMQMDAQGFISNEEKEIIDTLLKKILLSIMDETQVH